MQKTWKPMAAGIMCIVTGAAAMFAVGMMVARGLASPPSTTGDVNLGLYVMVVFVVGPSVTLGTVAIAGGVCALRRRVWGLALAGAIVLVVIGILGVILTSPPLAGVGVIGILSIIFVGLGKREFGKVQKPGVGDG
jgi:hypothetical protein